MSLRGGREGTGRRERGHRRRGTHDEIVKQGRTHMQSVPLRWPHTCSQHRCEVASPSDIAGGDGASGDGTVSAVELEAVVGGRGYNHGGREGGRGGGGEGGREGGGEGGRREVGGREGGGGGGGEGGREGGKEGGREGGTMRKQAS